MTRVLGGDVVVGGLEGRVAVPEGTQSALDII